MLRIIGGIEFELNGDQVLALDEWTAAEEQLAKAFSSGVVSPNALPESRRQAFLDALSALNIKTACELAVYSLWFCGATLRESDRFPVLAREMEDVARRIQAAVLRDVIDRIGTSR